MTFLARATGSGTAVDRPLVTPTSESGRRGAVQRAVAAALTPSRLSLGRATAGAVMLVRPRDLTGRLGVDAGACADTSWVVQLLGAREVAIGLGALTALRRRDDRAARLWLAAGLLCDAVDAVVLGAAVGRGQVRAAPGAAAVAVATTAAGVQAAALSRG